MDIEGIEKLKKDLVILEAMVADMDAYLRSDVLFWPLQNGDLPRLTLGGYLMRQHRLDVLRNLLDEAEQTRLDAALESFRQALVEKIVRFETKAHEEWEVRLRQWDRFLQGMGSESSSAAYYPNTVETRAMLEALLNQLKIAPYQLPQRAQERINIMDRQLRGRFQNGAFIWPETWQPAYPQTRYWWLYGQLG